MKSTLFNRARRYIELQLKTLQSEHRRAQMRRRIEMVTAGLKAYEAKRMTDAVLSYQGFLKLMEDHKGTGEGGLTPVNFDPVKEIGDLLLTTGVYWELTKLFDHTRSDDRRRDFLHYMEKFILFSKGAHYQALCAESLRRYISNSRSIHKDEFKNAYKVLGDGRCFVVTSLMDVTELETLPRLRRFRDDVLARSFAGRISIRIYYALGPSIARVADRAPEFSRRRLGRALDRFARFIAEAPSRR